MQKLTRQVKFYNLLFFLVLTSNLSASILKKDKMQLNIKAENVEIFDNNKKAIFSQNVKIKDKEWTLFADKVIVIYNEKDIEKIDAYGNIRLRSKNVKATGEKAIYLSKEKIIKMEKNVNAEENGMNVRGDTFIYDIEKKEGNMEMEEGKKVEIIIENKKE